MNTCSSARTSIVEAGKAIAHVGVMASVGASNATFRHARGRLAGLDTPNRRCETDAKGAGMYWTHYGPNGGFLDLSAQVLHYRNRYHDQYLAAASRAAGVAPSRRRLARRMRSEARTG